MWQISEGLFAIVAIVFLFGILSLPPRHKKARPLRDGGMPSESAMAYRTTNTSQIAIEQAALGKEPRAYSVDQKTASVPPTH